MMKRKTLSMWAILMIIVFAGTVIIYPMIFNPSGNKAPESTNTPNGPDNPVLPAPPPPTIPPVR